MGDFLVFERFVWFDTQVRQKRFPNAGKLADHFELSRKTAQRNINFMRDRLIAPLEYAPSKKGYHYLDETFFFWIHTEILWAVSGFQKWGARP